MTSLAGKRNQLQKSDECANDNGEPARNATIDRHNTGSNRFGGGQKFSLKETRSLIHRSELANLKRSFQRFQTYWGTQQHPSVHPHREGLLAYIGEFNPTPLSPGPYIQIHSGDLTYTRGFSRSASRELQFLHSLEASFAEKFLAYRTRRGEGRTPAFSTFGFGELPLKLCSGICSLHLRVEDTRRGS